MPSHFHSAAKCDGSSAGRVLFLDRVAQHHRAERRRIDADGLFGAAFDPGEQFGVGRRERRPQQLDLVRLLVAERRDRGLRKPRRHADAQRAGDELQQRPAPGLVERIEPGGKLRRQLGLAERGEGGDDVGEGGGLSFARCAPLRLARGGWRPKAAAGGGCARRPHPHLARLASLATLPRFAGRGMSGPATSARRSPTDRPHSRTTARTALGSVRSAISARMMPGLAWRNDSAPVIAASA